MADRIAALMEYHAAPPAYKTDNDILIKLRLLAHSMDGAIPDKKAVEWALSKLAMTEIKNLFGSLEKALNEATIIGDIYGNPLGMAVRLRQLESRLGRKATDSDILMDPSLPVPNRYHREFKTLENARVFGLPTEPKGSAPDSALYKLYRAMTETGYRAPPFAQWKTVTSNSSPASNPYRIAAQYSWPTLQRTFAGRQQLYNFLEALWNRDNSNPMPVKAVFEMPDDVEAAPFNSEELKVYEKRPSFLRLTGKIGILIELNHKERTCKVLKPRGKNSSVLAFSWLKDQTGIKDLNIVEKMLALKNWGLTYRQPDYRNMDLAWPDLMTSLNDIGVMDRMVEILSQIEPAFAAANRAFLRVRKESKVGSDKLAIFDILTEESLAEFSRDPHVAVLAFQKNPLTNLFDLIGISGMRSLDLSLQYFFGEISTELHPLIKKAVGKYLTSNTILLKEAAQTPRRDKLYFNDLERFFAEGSISSTKLAAVMQLLSNEPMERSKRFSFVAETPLGTNRGKHIIGITVTPKSLRENIAPSQSHAFGIEFEWDRRIKDFVPVATVGKKGFLLALAWLNGEGIETDHIIEKAVVAFQLGHVRMSDGDETNDVDRAITTLDLRDYFKRYGSEAPFRLARLLFYLLPNLDKISEEVTIASLLREGRINGLRVVPKGHPPLSKNHARMTFSTGGTDSYRLVGHSGPKGRLLAAAIRGTQENGGGYILPPGALTSHQLPASLQKIVDTSRTIGNMKPERRR